MVAAAPGVSIRDIRQEQKHPSDSTVDITFELVSGSNSVQVLGEIKRTVIVYRATTRIPDIAERCAREFSSGTEG